VPDSDPAYAMRAIALIVSRETTAAGERARS